MIFYILLYVLLSLSLEDEKVLIAKYGLLFGGYLSSHIRITPMVQSDITLGTHIKTTLMEAIHSILEEMIPMEPTHILDHIPDHIQDHIQDHIHIIMTQIIPTELTHILDLIHITMTPTILMEPTHILDHIHITTTLTILTELTHILDPILDLIQDLTHIIMTPTIPTVPMELIKAKNQTRVTKNQKRCQKRNTQIRNIQRRAIKIK